ncbi:hypothetical protein [Hydromonas duriensis]|uniref:Zinc ribbon domain-containing protein n=1 Tax=Hydromonas duriensis TaxID=1527608 RepID=A0A4R6Y8S9_9BURK|nr:hypothetical protein [Hydromonas duriensis]TDR31817.1 hypothetical protein DFR44_10734 [Hydromonas duriensis]
MKQCPQCQQQYADNQNFCANDGSPLNKVEAISPAPASPQTAQATPQKPIVLYVILALLIGAIAAGGFMWFNQNSVSNAVAAKEKEMQTKVEQTQKAQEKKDAEKQTAGVVKKSSSAGTKGELALVNAPPSNVRESANGPVLCTLTKKASINTFGVAEVSYNKVEDMDVEWYYTDACGKMGVIAATQLTF